MTLLEKNAIINCDIVFEKTKIVVENYYKMVGIHESVRSYIPSHRLLAFAVACNRHFERVDVSAAYLDAVIDCEVIIEHQTASSQQIKLPHHVLLLQTSIYGIL